MLLQAAGEMDASHWIEWTHFDSQVAKKHNMADFESNSGVIEVLNGSRTEQNRNTSSFAFQLTVCMSLWS